MTENTQPWTTRRSAMKLVGGTAAAAAGYTGVGAAEDGPEVSTDASGNVQWVLRFRPTDARITGSADVEQKQVDAYSTQQQAVSSLQSLEGYTVESRFWLANAVLVTAEKEPEAAHAELQALSNVNSVHPNLIVRKPEPVDENELKPTEHGEYTFGLEQINVPELWEQFETKGEGASVAVLDTGIDASHPDLELAEDGWAYFDNAGNEVDSDPVDEDGHGTHVSGTVAGSSAANREDGIHYGVAPNVSLYHGRVLDPRGTFAQIVAAMEWAVENDVDVINMSLGGPGYSDPYIEPIQEAIDSGTIVVSSSGNDGPETSGSPGNVYDNFSIGATDSNRNIVSFSSGERITTPEAWTASWLTEEWPLEYYVPRVSAPGASVLSAQPEGEYGQLSGTSMASPHVAGAAALLRSIDPEISVAEIKSYLKETSMHGDGPEANPGPRYGKGIIDVLSAATAMTDDNVVEGTVTDPDGNNVAGARVSTDFGTWAETDANGQYSLHVADGEWEIEVEEFGLGGTAETVSVSGGETATKDISLEDEMDVKPLAGQPDVVGQGESFSVTVDVQNLESLTVTMDGGSDVTPDDLSASLGDTTVEIGQEVQLDSRLSGEATLVVDVADDAPTDTIELNHVFGGPRDQIKVETGPTEVMEDPDEANLKALDSSLTDSISIGGAVVPSLILENTGDKTAQMPVYWWLTDPQSRNVFVADTVTLEGGEQTTVNFGIRIPAGFTSPGTKEKHGWLFDGKTISQDAAYSGALHAISEVDAPARANYGDTMEVTVIAENLGNARGVDTLDFYFNGVFMARKTVFASPEGTDSVTFEFDTTEVVRDTYDYEIRVTNWLDEGEDDKNADVLYENSVVIGDATLTEQAIAYYTTDGEIDIIRAVNDWSNDEGFFSDLSDDKANSVIIELVNAWSG